MKEWTTIKEFSGYEINTDGEVRGLDRQVKVKNFSRFISGKTIKSRMNSFGYLDIRLSKDGYTKTCFIHRLIAITFIPNPEHKPYVNHINGIKTDNRIGNLEWVTQSENMKHAYRLGLCCTPEKRMVKVIDICTGKEFSTIKKASDYYEIKYSTLKGYLTGSRGNPTCLQIA